ncbi:hypothetical protein MLD38_012913 [Melastoma candidum]|uniref:Uncharacterized protein n=1 Tax=Melastoma candidum TaxID=119954 RepID=A0ACB9R960_9MYRT|nr:hypothetical protein MLD38_012913 [Melastoma candidum]
MATPPSPNRLSSSPATPPLPPPQNDAGLPFLSPTLPRRAVLFSSLVSVVPEIANSPPASAFSIGISGPKEWLKDQKRKSSKYLLAPIYASREILQSAYLILSKGSESLVADAEEIQRLFRSAARDCVTQDRNSFVTFQANTGVEVCTFTLIVKNAASLLDNKDPVKLGAEAVLNDLIRSFSSLNTLANGTDSQTISNSRQKIIDALMDTITSLDKFEKGVKDCLEA